MQIPGATSRLDKVWPYWWTREGMPRTAQLFDIRGRVDITPLEDGNEVILCGGAIPDNQAGVVFYELMSYLTQASGTGQSSILEDPGAFAGQFYWLPRVGKTASGSSLSFYPNQDGYIGSPLPVIGRKHSGYNQALRGSDCDSILPLILGPGQEFDIFIKMLEREAGDIIPDDQSRFAYGRLYGWTVPLPPADPYLKE